MDHDRFMRLYLPVQPRIWSYLLGLVRSTADADDVSQQVSLVLWERFAEYDASRPFLPWALGVARNHAARWRQQRARTPAWLPPDVEEKLAQTAAELEEELAPRRDALRACIEKLGERARALLAMRYTERQSLATIAQRQGTSLNAVNKALGKIRRFLMECTAHA